MTIQLNSDKNLDIHEDFEDTLKQMITTGLAHVSDHITRIEVHLSDQNGAKAGIDDKRCVLEARQEGKQPIAVSADGNTHEQSLKAAIQKLKVSLETIIGRQRNH